MPRVIDCCLFNGEWDLLALRFATLRDVVDTFIVVEGDRTHSGLPRVTHGGRIAALAPSTRECWTIAAPLPAPQPDRWLPERTQRNAMIMGLLAARAEADDHILMSDLDEIPDPAHIRAVGTHWQRQSLYYLNAVCDGCEWPGTIGVPYEMLQFTTPAGLRAQNGRLPRMVGGWHFSYMGGVEAMRHKLRSFAHAEYDTADVHDALPAQLAALADPFGRTHCNQGVHVVPVDVTFPAPLQRDPTPWAHLLAEVPA